MNHECRWCKAVDDLVETPVRTALECRDDAACTKRYDAMLRYHRRNGPIPFLGGLRVASR